MGHGSWWEGAEDGVWLAFFSSPGEGGFAMWPGDVVDTLSEDYKVHDSNLRVKSEQLGGKSSSVYLR